MTPLAMLDGAPTQAFFSVHAPGETTAGTLAEHDLESVREAFLESTTLQTHLLASCSRWLEPSVVLWMSKATRPTNEALSEQLCRHLEETRLMPFARLFGEVHRFPDPTPSVLLASIGGLHARAMVDASEAPAFRAFKDLGHWLHADDASVADMVGVGRTTPYTWKRGGEPRAGTAQRVYEYQATLDSLRRRLGLEAFERWLQEGTPARRNVLLQGNLESLDADVHAILFRRTPEQRVDLAAAPDAPTSLEGADSKRRLRPSRRDPRRSRG